MKIFHQIMRIIIELFKNFEIDKLKDEIDKLITRYEISEENEEITFKESFIF